MKPNWLPLATAGPVLINHTWSHISHLSKALGCKFWLLAHPISNLLTEFGAEELGVDYFIYSQCKLCSCCWGFLRCQSLRSWQSSDAYPAECSGSSSPGEGWACCAHGGGRGGSARRSVVWCLHLEEKCNASGCIPLECRLQSKKNRGTFLSFKNLQSVEWIVVYFKASLLHKGQTSYIKGRPNVRLFTQSWSRLQATHSQTCP